MLTKLTIRNFKRFDEVEVELGNPVVFVGPNNSGKTSAMQALALWDVGVKRWREKQTGKNGPKKRTGVTVNRKDLLAIPHPNARLLWRDGRARHIDRSRKSTKTNNVLIDLIVEGVVQDNAWTCGMEFYFANEESFYCRPLRLEEGSSPKRMPVPDEVASVRMAFLPPMSGLAATETRLDQGAVNVRVGEGRTAEVLRNLCYSVMTNAPAQWGKLVEQMESLFGVRLDEPRYVEERGEITMGYRERNTELDLSSSGRGLQQTLLILAYMAANPGTVVLLDEPDAHLEILRQREIYRLLTETADAGGNQIIAATHSEVLLNEAADRDLAIAFVGRPHSIGNRGAQVRKALAEIGFDQYYQAELTGWVLYLEGSTDLAILQALARRLGHDEAIKALERPFVHYVGNQPKRAEDHFYGLQEAVPELKGIGIYDRLEQKPPTNPSIEHLTWQRREIENYLCTEKTLESYARASKTENAASTMTQADIFAEAGVEQRLQAMRDAIAEVSTALQTLDKGSPWDVNVKASDDFLTPLFAKYFNTLELPNLMAKKDFYELASHIPAEEIGPEISEKLDAIARVANSGMSPMGGNT